MSVDLAVIGAGPAGIAAAVLGAELGLATLLVDEQPAPGGQIYRGVEAARDGSPLGAAYLAGRALTAALRASAVEYRPETAVWHIAGDGTLALLAGGGCAQVQARRIVLATGAIERPVPIPGWILPGVMGVGGAQILLKQARLVPAGRSVLAGQGPLLYLVAAQFIRAGAPPMLLLETTPVASYRRAAALLAARPGWGRLGEGLGLIGEIRRAGVPIRRRVRGLRALPGGDGTLARVAWEGGEIAAELLLLHDGVIPNVQISLALQLAHHWDPAQLCWRPTLDAWGASSRADVAIAGDGAGILDAEAAIAAGRLAAIDAAFRLGRIDVTTRDARAAPLRREITRAARLRRFLDVLYRPLPQTLLPVADDIVICRCEEVTARRIRAAARLGATGPNQLKAFTRCGMGPCQGRICGSLVAALIADTRGDDIAATGTYRPRAPYTPITVGALAGGDGAAS